jgi:hypothetical protein
MWTIRTHDTARTTPTRQLRTPDQVLGYEVPPAGEAPATRPSFREIARRLRPARTAGRFGLPSGLTAPAPDRDLVPFQVLCVAGTICLIWPAQAFSWLVLGACVVWVYARYRSRTTS